MIKWMESPLAPVLANLFMGYNESIWIEKQFIDLLASPKRSSSPQPLSQELSNQVYPWPADLLLKSIPHDLRFAIEIRISNPKRPGWRELAQELLFDEETILCIDNHNQPEKGYLLFEVLNTQKPKLTFTAFVDVLAMLKRVDVVEKSKDYYRDNNDVNNVTLEDS
ncbi:hypothetical protein AC249_AIPGENE16559 [Exaiptasia diaphana]|nr:hypothetical protein AC249_AIPGENE16559 [Exaiptasia diaphana]